jgi:hypothetical protein
MLIGFIDQQTRGGAPSCGSMIVPFKPAATFDHRRVHFMKLGFFPGKSIMNLMVFNKIEPTNHWRFSLV